MQDLESLRLLDEETRVLVLAAFEQAIHVSFRKFKAASANALLISLRSSTLYHGSSGSHFSNEYEFISLEAN